MPVNTRYSNRTNWETTRTIINGTSYERPISRKNLDYIPGCQSTWLIQRISRSVTARDDDFPPCRFEYMGSAEFEFGAIPKTLKKMRERAEENELVAYSLDVFGPPELSWEIRRDLDYNEANKVLGKHILETTLFVIAPALLRPHVDEVLQMIAFGEEHLKESANLRERIFCIGEECDTCAWLELDNGFMFFSDELMWVSFCNLFNVQHPDVEELVTKVPDLSEVKRELSELAK